MTQEHFFGNAKWVGAPERTAASFSVLRGRFSIKSTDKVTLNVLGLGFFKCYINGVCINPDTFLPLSSDYEASCDPMGEILSGHRVYVPSFEITDFVKEGENVIDIHFGGGWYTLPRRTFGLPKAIYRISDGICESLSDEHCLVGKSFVSDYNFTTHESHDYTADEQSWERAVLTEPLVTEYCEMTCPADGLISTIFPRKTSATIYDCGANTTGVPVLKICAKRGEKITVRFSEEILENGELDITHAHKQCFTVVSNGEKRTVQPEFTWFGFRYLEVLGNAEPTSVKVIHAKIPVTSSFECDNETLNWAYKTFLHTMLCNLHTGHPSDCPHIERRGYTGDGQLTCHAVLSTLGARALYEKWMQDIADSQDTLSGHVQYTAPHVLSGGGPGGWGCAIIEVAYQLYRHYGETEILSKYYKNMRKYLDFLEAHSEFGLVTSDKEGAWCLGDWCMPIVVYPDKDIVSSHRQQVALPAAMVNTYFFVKSLDRMCEIAKILEKDEDIPAFEAKATEHRKAITAAYYNSFDANFLMNLQGANAYAIDLGLGNEHTRKSLVDYYQKLGCLDTGIFGTDILIRVLFEMGEDELAVDLLTSEGKQGFEQWRQNGATTFHEYWDSSRSRSHNHPMFGASVAYFFEYLLGIRQAPNTAGYTSLIIEPRALTKFQWMRGSMEFSNGVASVSYKKKNEAISFNILLPPKTKATFKYKNQEISLIDGENKFDISL